MPKKKYYTYISNLSSSYNDINVGGPYIQNDLRIHPHHANVLDLDFETGQLVETYNGNLGIVIERLSEYRDIKSISPCTVMYKVQVGSVVEYWMSMSLRKIKK